MIDDDISLALAYMQEQEVFEGLSKPAKALVPAKAPKGMSMPKVGSLEPVQAPKPVEAQLTPKEFMSALRASYRAKSPDEKRALAIAAMRKFGGYSIGIPFGTQLDEATARARVALTGVSSELSPSEKRSTYATVSGYVKGMPAPETRRIDDLRGRMQVALDCVRIHERTMSDSSLSPEKRKIAKGMAKIERQRFFAIRDEVNSAD